MNKRGTETINNPSYVNSDRRMQIPVYNWDVEMSREPMWRFCPLRRPIQNIPPTTRIYCQLVSLGVSYHHKQKHGIGDESIDCKHREHDGTTISLVKRDNLLI